MKIIISCSLAVLVCVCLISGSMRCADAASLQQLAGGFFPTHGKTIVPEKSKKQQGSLQKLDDVLFFLRQILGLQWKSEAEKRERSGRQSEDEALSVRFKGDLLSMLETF